MFWRCFSICVLGFTLTGCEAYSALAYKLAGPDPTPAQYTLEQKPTVIIAENYHDPDAMLADSETLVKFIYEDLKAQKREVEKKEESDQLVPLVDWLTVFNLRSDDPQKFAKMKISDIGRAAGAKQIIYVDLMASSVQLTMGSDMLHGEAGARVRVIDVETGQTKWPEGTQGGSPVSVETKMVRISEGATKERIRQETLEELGKKVARLFYTWQAEK